MSNQIQAGAPGPEGTASLPGPKKRDFGSSTGTYTTAAIVCFLLACTIFIIAKPVEKTGPPRPDQGVAGAMPQGHPDTAHNHEHGSPEITVEQIQAHLTMLRDAEKAHADDPVLHLEMANTLYDLAEMTNSTEQFAESLERYRKYLQAQPEDVNARTDMAYTLFRTGQLDEAITELSKVQAQDPRHQQSAFNLARMYKEKDQPDSVLAYLQRTADIDSTTDAGRTAIAALGAYRGAH